MTGSGSRRRLPPAVIGWTVAGIGAAGAAVVLLLAIARLPGAGMQLTVGLAVAIVVVTVAVTLRTGVGALAYPVLVLTGFLLPLNRVRLDLWITWADVTLVLAGGLGLLHPAFARRPVRVPRSFTVGMLVLLASGAAGSLVGEAVTVGLANFARLMVTAAVAVVAVLFWRPELAQLTVPIRAWLAGNALNVVVAVLYVPQFAGQRPAGLTTHPNALGLVCVLSMGLAFVLLAIGSRWDRLLAMPSAALAVVGTLLSGSRAALLALVAVLVVRAVLGRAWLLLGAVVAVLAVAVPFGSRYLSTLGAETAILRLFRPDSSVVRSDESRLGRLRSAGELFRDHPIVGSGFDNATEAHNLFLQILVAAGAVGLAGFLLMCWPMLSGLWRKGEPGWRLFSLLPLGFLVDAMFSNNVWDRYIWLMLALGLYAATRQSEGPPAVSPQAPPPGARLASLRDLT